MDNLIIKLDLFPCNLASEHNAASRSQGKQRRGRVQGFPTTSVLKSRKRIGRVDAPCFAGDTSRRSARLGGTEFGPQRPRFPKKHTISYRYAWVTLLDTCYPKIYFSFAVVKYLRLHYTRFFPDYFFLSTIEVMPLVAS